MFTKPKWLLTDPTSITTGTYIVVVPKETGNSKNKSNK